MNQISPKILQPGTVEFYANAGTAYAFIHGVQLPISSWPLRIVEMIRTDLDKHPGAESALERMGITDPVEQINQYVMCMYGELNLEPDFINYKPSQDTEFTSLICSSQNCQFRGILCKLVHADYGDLTAREVDICKLLADDNTCNDIALALGISVNTVNTHITNILPKIGVRNARAAAVWASKHLPVK